MWVKGTVWTDPMEMTVSVGERDCVDRSDEDDLSLGERDCVDRSDGDGCKCGWRLCAFASTVIPL